MGNWYVEDEIVETKCECYEMSDGEMSDLLCDE